MESQDKEVLQLFIATEIEKDEFYRRWPDYEREHPDHRIGDPYSLGVAVGVSRIKKKLEKFLRLDEDFVDSICERIGINPPYLDGDSWCVLLGSDIQDGICGFGRTKFEALLDFMKTIILQTKNSQARFPQYHTIVEKVFGAGNLEGWEFREAEMLVALAKEELLKSFQQEQTEVDLEKAAQHVYESWMGGTMDDVRRDMVELGKVLNARKEE